MRDLLFIPSAIVYLVVVGLLFLYGLNFFYLTSLAWRRRSRLPEPPEIDHWPPVTVQLPIYNEMYVAERLIEAAAGLDYPDDCLEIQVLDDSNDETVLIVERLVSNLQARGVNIHHIRRPDRKGYKAGALAEGLQLAGGEYLAIFDADFIPPPDFLRRTLPHFQDGQVGFVQARWGHVNRDYSLLTSLQALAFDAYFMVEQFARSQDGYWFNFNGTAGVWRRQTIESIGGWTFDTLTEDLDLSYRAFFSGWRGVYLRDLEVRAELPVNFNAYRRQQSRWARGSLECARKYLPRLWNAPIPLSVKLEASFHLMGYGIHLLMFALLLLYPLVLSFSQVYTHLISSFGLGIIFNVTAFAPITLFAVAQHQLGNRWWRRLPEMLLISTLGAGMMLNTIRAAFQTIGNRPKVFDRTPKFGVRQKKEDWTRRRYQLRLDPIVYLEFCLALANTLTIHMAFQAHNWLIALYALIFCCGLLYTSSLSVLHTLQVVWHRTRPIHE